MQHTEYTLILVLSVFNNTRPVKKHKPAPVTNFPGLCFGQRGSLCDGWVTPFFQAGIDLNDIGSTFRAIRQCIDFAVSDGVSIDDSATLLPLVQTNLRGIVSPAIADHALWQTVHTMVSNFNLTWVSFAVLKVNPDAFITDVLAQSLRINSDLHQTQIASNYTTCFPDLSIRGLSMVPEPLFFSEERHIIT